MVQWSTLAGRIFFLSRRIKFVRSVHGGRTEVVRTLLCILCVQPSVITPYELFLPRQKKNSTSQRAPLDQFLVQWSTLAGRICVAGTMAHQNLKRKWGVTMLVCELPRLELAKRGKMGFLATSPPVHMKVYESHPFALYSIRGNILLKFYGLYTHVHRDSSCFWDVIICRKPKKRHFFHFCLSPGGAIIILQPHKLAFCATGTMAHQNLKRKWGVTMLVCELPRLELAKREKWDFCPHSPPVYESV